jgi:4-amino-4-deoxy-L-arabinose transferase-like glycosyltransferase
VLVVVALASWHFKTVPVTWYDEGINLQAARTLARTGQYGLVYAQDVRLFDLQLTTGPTVIAPIALVFKMFGVGLAQGRVVMVGYTVLAALGLYRLGRLLYGTSVAALAVLVLCATDRASPGVTRDVVGEVAALAFFFWGAALFVTARATGGTIRYVGAGLLFGLAILTKGQFGLLLPALVTVWLVTRGRPGDFRGRNLLLMLTLAMTSPALWQLYQMVDLGGAGFMDHLRGLSAASSVSATVLPFSNMSTGIRSLVSSSWAVLGLAGLAYVWLAAIGPGWRKAPAERLLLPTFASAWLVWYLSLSVGYDRYTIPLIATCALFAAALFCDLIRRFGVAANLKRRSAWHVLVADPALSGLLLIPAALIVSGITLQLMNLRRPPESAAQEIAGLITRDVEPRATTESFEWQLDVLTERPFHHPPPFVPAIPYDVSATTTFLVDGPMSKTWALYSSELKEHNYRLVASAGPYDLYQRQPLP